MAVDALDFLDEHEVVVDADPGATWDAVLDLVRGTFRGKAIGSFGRVLGCEPAAASGWDDPGVGTTVIGFRIVDADRPHRLVVEGRHHFSRYGIVFRIQPDAGGTRCTIESRADFPGVHGRLYRLAVIGTGGHVVAVRRMLHTIARSAQRDEDSRPGGTMAR